MGYKPVDTAIVMVIGPCIDDTDFKTLEEAIAYDAAGMDVSLIVEKTDGTSAVTAITLTTGGTSDWTHKDGGYYEVEITAVQNAEEGIAYVRGVCTGVLPFESAHYNIVTANVYDSLVKGTDNLEVDATAISGDSVSADNLELDYDGTGYTKTNSVIGTCTTNTDMVGTAPTAVQNRQEMDSNSTQFTAIVGDTNELQTNQGNWLTAVGFSTHTAADIWSVATRILTANTNFNDLTAAQINTEVANALAAIKLDHLINSAVDTNWATTVHLDSVIGHIADVGTLATFSRTTDALEAIRDRGDAEWITATGFNTVVPDPAGTALSAAEVNAEVVDVMRVDTTTEMSQGAPPITPTLEDMIAHIYFRLINKCETTNTEDAVYNNAGTVKLFKSTIGDDGTTFTKSSSVSGA